MEDDDDWTPEEVERLQTVMRCQHDWPRGESGYEPCRTCGWVGVRHVELSSEEFANLVEQLAQWELQPEEVLAGKLPNEGESALDYININEERVCDDR